MGPMTRSRKRKMQDTSVSITPAYPGSNPASLEIVTVTKRDRTAHDQVVFPAAASASNTMQYCATARAVVVSGSNPASTWTPTANNGGRSVTITID